MPGLREETMTHFETSRVNEVIGLNIGIVQEAARRLSAALDIEVLENEIVALEKSIEELKRSLAALPYRR